MSKAIIEFVLLGRDLWSINFRISEKITVNNKWYLYRYTTN